MRLNNASPLFAYTQQPSLGAIALYISDLLIANLSAKPKLLDFPVDSRLFLS